MSTNNPTSSFSWKTAILLFLGVGLLTAGLSVFLQARSQTLQNIQTVNPAPQIAIQSTSTDGSASIQNAFTGGAIADPTSTPTSTSATATAGLGSSFNAPSKPIRLIIPAIGVNAAIQSVGLFWNGNGEMSIPTNFTDVAWYNGGPRPGMPGSAVIDGHLDGQYVQRAVFYNLQNLKVGDAVKVVDASGTTFTFQVVASKAYAYNASTTDIFSNDTSKARLNLITCTGDWIKSQKLYNQRIVVFTELVGSSR